MEINYREEYLQLLDSADILYESRLLEIIYGNAYCGKKNPEIVAALLRRFPSVKAIMQADLEEIMAVDGVPKNFAYYLKTLDRIDKLINTNEIVINSTEDCFKVIAERFRAKDNEYIEIYLLNKGGKVIDIKTYTSYLADRVDVSANTVFSTITSSRAYGLYLAHNHVNASVTPSGDDDRFTAKLATACAMCNIRFFDHCIINSRAETYSYLQSGRFKKVLDKIK